MAKIYVLTGDGQHWKLVMHFLVPVGTNSAGMLWSTALINSGLGLHTDTDRRTILKSGTGPDQISTEEEDRLDSGEMYEHVRDDYLIESGGLSNPELKNTLLKFYQMEEDSTQDRLAAKLKYYGHKEGNI